MLVTFQTTMQGSGSLFFLCFNRAGSVSHFCFWMILVLVLLEFILEFIGIYFGFIIIFLFVLLEFLGLLEFKGKLEVVSAAGFIVWASDPLQL